jgi:hypothetical protein
MAEMFSTLGTWNWLIFGVVLMALELLAPGVFLFQRHRARQHSAASKSNPFLNKRADALVGRVFTLEKPIIDGSGTVRIDDTVWRVAGPDAPAGSRVRIVQADGASLTVAAA